MCSAGTLVTGTLVTGTLVLAIVLGGAGILVLYLVLGGAETLVLVLGGASTGTLVLVVLVLMYMLYVVDIVVAVIFDIMFIGALEFKGISDIVDALLMLLVGVASLVHAVGMVEDIILAMPNDVLPAIGIIVVVVDLIKGFGITPITNCI